MHPGQKFRPGCALLGHLSLIAAIVFIMPPRRYLSLAISIASLFAAPSIHLQAQIVPAKDRLQILTAARSQYYNLRTAGLKSFICNVDVDWDALFISISGKPLPSDDPMMQYLDKSRLSLSVSTSGTSNVSWANTGLPPEGKEESTDKLRSGIKQTLDGFIQAWIPSLNGTLINLTAKSLTATPSGFLLDDGTANSPDILTLDKNYVVTHVSNKSEMMSGELDATFTSSEKGLLMSKLDGLYRQPASAPPTHVVMSATFQPVDSFLLPQELAFTVTNVAIFKMQLVGCTIQKQP